MASPLVYLALSLCLMSTDRLLVSCKLEGEILVGGETEPYLVKNETVFNHKQAEPSKPYTLYENAHNATFSTSPGELTHSYDVLYGASEDLHAHRWEIVAPQGSQVYVSSLHYEVYTNAYDLDEARLRQLVSVLDEDGVHGATVVYRLGDETLDDAVSSKGKLTVVVNKPRSLHVENNVVSVANVRVRYAFL